LGHQIISRSWRIFTLPAKSHIVLAGDSIFDNAAYTGGEPDVITHLNSLLPSGSRATLVAVDGATVSGLSAQLRQLPKDATHLVISIGGNDALSNIDLLSLRAAGSAEVLQVFATRIGAFERAYRAAIAEALTHQLPVTLCTIYNGALEKDIATIARLALALFNDVILRTAADRQLDVIELRAICTEAGDYANPIEPSGSGGLKIAKAIARALDGMMRASRVFAGWSE
jgi:lysophospholipase L1-like esterase